MPGKNTKRRKRLLLIAGVVGVLGAGSVAVWYGRRYSLDKRAEAKLEEGRTALAEGNNQKAVEGMGQYIQRLGWREDTKAKVFVDYAKAREKVPEANNAHLVEAMGALKRGLQKEPDSREAQEQLLSLYMRTGFASEALDLADQMLVKTPDDVNLLRSKADVLEALRRQPLALPIAKSIAGRKDATHDDLVRVLRLMVRTDTTPNEIDTWIDAAAATRPGDQFVELLRATVLSMRGDTAGANRILDKILAASSPADDARSLSFLVLALDENGRYADALKLLTRLEETDDPVLRRDIVRRVWFSGQVEETLARAERWDADKDTADAEILAIHVLALSAQGRKADADPIVQKLAARSDRIGAAWAAVVNAATGRGPSAAENLTALDKASSVVPENGLILGALGNAAAEMGEWDAAVKAWTAAASRAPAWAVPHTGLARAHRLMRRPELEIRAAGAALRRAPTTIEALRAWIEATSNNIEKLNEEQQAEFLKKLAQVQANDAKLADVVLPIRVSLVARNDKALAESLLKAAADAPTTYSENTLLRLATIAAGLGSPTDAALLAATETVHGVTPRLAYGKAVLRVRTGTQADALAVYDELRSKDSSHKATDLEWSITRTKLLDAFGRSDAGPAWTAIADANPASLQAQLGALASEAFLADREAAGRAIERVKGLTGEGGTTWRIARARLLLTTPSAAEKDFTAASEILTTVVRDAPQNGPARIYLAQALERLGDLKGAEEQLQVAANLAPDDTTLALELARLAQMRGRNDEARRKLDHVLSAGQLSPQQSQRAAALLAVDGDLGRSAELLEQLRKGSQTDAEGTLLLAKINARQGRIDDAIRLCESIADHPTGPSVELTAGLYAFAGRAADAETALAKLDKLGLPPGDLEMIRARHAGAFGQPAVAKEWYAKAVDAAPGRADAWVARIRIAMAEGDKPGLAALLDDPRAAGIEPVQFLKSVRDLAEAAAGDPGLRGLLLGALDDKPSRLGVTQALRLMTRDWPDRSKREQVARSMVELANANVGVLSLQLAAADVSLQSGNVRTACDLMQRTASAFPSSAIAARRNAEILSVAGRWADALEAGRTWRDRADRQDLNPDEFIGRVLLRLGRPDDAVAALEEHVKAASARPDDNERLLLTYSVALVRSGRAVRAAETFRTLAAKSPRWNTLPLTVGPDWMGSPAESMAWLGACETLVPATDMKARVLYGQAWVGAATKFPTGEMFAGARKVLGEITASPDAPAEAWFFAGSLAQLENDLATARTAYEKALQKNPGLDIARNNLAMVLADAGQCDEAVEHATKVLKAHPQSAEAMDTVAYTLRKGKKYDEARARLGEAIAMEPASMKWRVSLAETIAEQGDVNSLTPVLAQIRKMEEAGVPVTGDLRARIDRFRPKR